MKQFEVRQKHSAARRIFNSLLSADLLATDKSRYFAQPRPIIVNYFLLYRGVTRESNLNTSLITSYRK